MKPFDRWHSKLRIEAKEFKGQIKVDLVHVDGKPGGGTRAQMALMLMVRLGEEARVVLQTFELGILEKEKRAKEAAAPRTTGDLIRRSDYPMKGEKVFDREKVLGGEK